MNDTFLMPSLFSDFVGQKRVVARIEIVIAAAKQRGEAVSHILLCGLPGLGKATLAYIIANAMGSNVKHVTDGSIIQRSSDLAGLLTNLEEGDVLYIDEIHNLPKKIEELLCFAMRDFQLDVTIDQGPNARSVRLNLPRFTVIGSAPRKEKLSTTLLYRFPIIENFDNYSVDELAIIARRFAKLLKIEIDEAVDIKIARSSDGTPLDILNRLQHFRDYARVKGSEKITLDIATAASEMLAPEKLEFDQGRLAISSEVRREVWRRDQGKCTKCGNRENLEYDHIIPFSKGGSNTARNIELLCEACNRAKSASIQ
jgi:Holliday junction DNA helicase RuvB